MNVQCNIHLSELVVTALAASVPNDLILESDRDVLEQRALFALRSMLQGVIMPIATSTTLAYVAGNHDLRDWGEDSIGVRVDICPG